MTHSLRRVASLLACLLAGAAMNTVAEAQVVCAKQLTCPAHTWLAAVRTPYYGKNWYYIAVPSGARTLFNGDQTIAFADLCDRAISTWTSNSDTLPHDRIGPATESFGWTWATQSLIQGVSNKRNNIPAAATQNFYEDAQRPCKITGSAIYFAVDPNDPSTQTDYFFGDSCGTGCLDYVIDFLGVAAHEYGHALGLDHPADTQALMYASISTGVAKNDPTACECDFVRKVFRDNFGPAVLDSFALQTLASGDVACSWSANKEEACRRYRVSKSCADGTAYVLADSMPCLGPGVVQTVVDSDVCPGMTLYSISLVDSLGPNLFQEVVLAERGYVAGGGPAPFRAAAVSAADAEEPPGFATPEEAVVGLGVAVTGRDPEQQRRLRADGFLYYVKDDPLFWGRAIDTILEERLLACLASQDSSIDSLAFVPVQVIYLDPAVAQVTADVHYVHRCQLAETDWAGQVVAIVERRYLEDGWRVRQVTEVEAPAGQGMTSGSVGFSPKR